MNDERMSIQWYPGHMTKTRRNMEQDIRLVDAVCELVDARSTSSPPPSPETTKFPPQQRTKHPPARNNYRTPIRIPDERSLSRCRKRSRCGNASAAAK